MPEVPLSTGLRPLACLLTIFLVGGLAGTPLASGQDPGGETTSERGGSPGGWVEVEVDADIVNDARRAAGQAVLRPKRGGETITLRYQRPVERRWSFGGALRAGRGSLSFGSDPSTSGGVASDGARVIEGLTLDDDQDLANATAIPADPHGAVGADHLCHVVNVLIQCQTKDGTSVLKQSLETLFGDGNDIFDPRVVYDARADRFVVVTLNKRDTGNASENISELFIAVSEVGDPSGTWSTQTVDMRESISVNGTITECWFDYPSITVDEEAIYITGSYFAFESESADGFCDVYLSIFDQGLYSGGQSNRVYLDDPNEDYIEGDFDGILQPAILQGSGPGGNIGTWLFQYSGLTTRTGGPDFWAVTRVDDPLGSRSFSTSLVSWDDVDDTSKENLPDAPQPSTTEKIETNDRRALDLEWRDGILWGVTTVIPPSGANADQATVFYGEVDVETLGDPVPGASGYLGGEDVESGAFTYYPSLAIDEVGNVAFAFSLSAEGTYAGSYVQTRSEQSGGLSSTLVAQEGVAGYVRTLGGENRWGDYSSMVLDPMDGSAWAVNKAALSTGSCTTSDGTQECGRWGAFLVQFAADVLPVEIASFEASADGGEAVLTWQTASETRNAGFEIHHRDPGTRVWSPAAFVGGAGTTGRSRTYRHRVSGLEPGSHAFRLLQVDVDGTKTRVGTASITVRPEGRFALQPPRPNPTAGDTRIRLSVQKEQSVRIAVYNTLGQRVRTVAQTSVSPAHTILVSMDAGDLAPGLYFVRVAGETFEATRRLTVVR